MICEQSAGYGVPMPAKMRDVLAGYDSDIVSIFRPLFALSDQFPT